MITFLVIIKEDDQGRVHLHSSTPSGACTYREQAAGFEFKRMFEDLARRHAPNGSVQIVRPWDATGQKPQSN